jgi:hypothetical protein
MVRIHLNDANVDQQIEITELPSAFRTTPGSVPNRGAAFFVFTGLLHRSAISYANRAVL